MRAHAPPPHRLPQRPPSGRLSCFLRRFARSLGVAGALALSLWLMPGEAAAQLTPPRVSAASGTAAAPNVILVGVIIRGRDLDTAYQVQWRLGSYGPWSTPSQFRTPMGADRSRSSFSFFFSRTEPYPVGTGVQMRARARLNGVTSAWSEPITVTLMRRSAVSPISRPGAPQSVRVRPAGATSLEVRWVPPASDGGSPVGDYNIRYRPAGTTSWTMWDAADTYDVMADPNTRATIEGLTEGQLYDVQVSAANFAATSGALRGPWTASVQSAPSATAQLTAELAATESQTAENAGFASIIVNFSARAERAFDLAYTLSGTATDTTDYTHGGSPLRVNVGDEQAEIRFQLVPDAVVDADETIVLTLAAGDDYTLGPNTAHTITIQDSPPTVSLGSSSYLVSEGGTLSVPIELSTPSSADVAIPYVVSAGSAVAADYSGIAASGTLTIAAGERSANLPTISIVASDGFEQDETFTIALGTPLPTGYMAGAPASATVTIRNTDAFTGMRPAVPRFFDTERQAFSGLILIVLRRVEGLEYELQWRRGTYGPWQAGPPFSSANIRDTSVTLELRSNQLLMRQHFPLGVLYQARARAVQNGQVSEWSEIREVNTFVQAAGLVRVRPPSAPSNLRVQAASATSLAVSWGMPTDTGNAPVGDYDVRYKRASATTWETWDPFDDSSDLSADTARSVVITGLTANALYDVQVRANNGSAGRELRPGSSTLYRITDRHGAWTPTVQAVVSASGGVTASFVEAESGTAETEDFFDVAVAFSAPAPAAFTLNYQLGGSATAGTDYTHAGSAPYSVSVARGDTRAILRFVPQRDLVAGEVEDIDITLLAGTGYALGSQTTHQLNIRDVPPPVVELDNATYRIAEGASFTPRLVLSEPLLEAATVFYTVTAGTADASADYSGISTSGMFSLAVGASGADFPTITMTDDALAEVDETFTIAVDTSRLPPLYAGSAASSATVTIADDDRANARVAFGSDAAASAAHTATVAENVSGGTLAIPLTISHVPGSDLVFTIEADAAASTATAGDDFSLGSATVRFAAGTNQLTQNFTLTLIDDALFERTEEIVLRVAAADARPNDVGDYYQRGNSARITLTSDDVTAPDAPTALALVSDNMRLRASWQAPELDGGRAISGYVVEYRAGTSGTWLDAGHSGTQPTHIIESLMNEQPYQVRVSATNNIGTGAPSEIQSATPLPEPLPPGQPAAPMLLVGAQQRTLVVSWTEPALRRGGAITEYEIRYMRRAQFGVSALTRTRRVGGTMTQVTLSGLLGGLTYGVEVRARNAVRTTSSGAVDGWGAWSAAASAVPLGVPGRIAPGGIRVRAGSGSGTLEVSWSPPANTGGSPITGYDVRWRLSNTAGALSPRNVSISGTSATISGLGQGRFYQVAVAAGNAQGFATVLFGSGQTRVGPPMRMARPVLEVRNRALRVRWAVPSDTGGEGVGINLYRLRWKRSDAAAFAAGDVMEVAGNAERAVTISGLTNEVSYDVQAQARNGRSLTGDWSNSAMAAPLPAPEPPAAAAAPRVSAPQRLGVLTLAWDAPATHPAAPLTGYELRWREQGASDWTALAHQGLARMSEVSGLADETVYEVQLRGVNRLGAADDWSPSGMGTTAEAQPSAAPQNVRVQAGDRSLNVSWTAPSVGGLVPPILSYRVEYQADGGNFVAAPSSGTQTRLVIQGLGDNQAYAVRVSAQNRAGMSPASAEGSGTTIDPVEPTQPAAPQLSSRSSGTLNVSWRPPANGGTPITNYELRYKLASEPASAWRSDENIRYSGITAEIGNLEEGEDYQVQVRAQNRVRSLSDGTEVDGWSPWSEAAVGSPSSATRNAQTASNTLAQVGNVLTAGVVDVLGGRLGGGAPAAGVPNIGGTGGGAESNFAARVALGGLGLAPQRDGRAARPVHTHANEPAPARDFTLLELLGGSAFELALAPRSAGDAESEAAGEPTAQLGLWGRGNVRGFSNTTKEQFRLEGENYTGWLGGDYRYKKILLGAAVAYDHAETRFESPGDHQGTVTTQLGGFYPYWRLMPNERVSLWGVMGFGWGMLELNEQGVEARTAPLRMQVYAGGLRADVLRVYGVDVAAKGDASYAIFRTSARPSLPAVESRPGRLRLALEGQRGFALGLHSLTPSAELGFRLDYNDAASGAGLEMGGGLLYRHQTLRLTANMRARGLVTHRNENLEEWGVSLLVRMEPDALGRGLFASLQPSWGRTASRREALWGEQNSLTDSPLLAARQSEPFRLQPSRLDAELGYGFLVWQERGRLSPFAQWGFALDGLQRVQLGSRLQLGEALGLEAFTERRTAPALPTDYEFGLRLNMRL